MKTYILTLFLLFNSGVSANTSNEKIIFGTENYAPFNYQSIKNDSVEGLSTDIIRALISLTKDTKSRIKVYPWARIYNMAQQQKNVAIFSIVRSKDREKLFKWAGVLYEPKMYIWKLKSRDDVEINGIEDLKKYKTVVNNQGIDEEIFTKHYGLTRTKQLQPVSQTQQKILMLVSKRADLMEYGEFALQWKMKQLDLDFNSVEKVMILPEMAKFSLAFSKQTDNEVVERYQKALAEIKANGTYDKILAKWSI